MSTGRTTQTPPLDDAALADQWEAIRSWALIRMHSTCPDDREDLASAFALQLILRGDPEAIATPGPRRQCYLKQAFRRFLVSHWRSEQTRANSEARYLDDESEDGPALIGPRAELESTILLLESTRSIWVQLQLLGECNTKLFWLRYYEGWSTRELASQFGIGEAAIRQRLRWIRQRVRRVLDEQSSGEPTHGLATTE